MTFRVVAEALEVEVAVAAVESILTVSEVVILEVAVLAVTGKTYPG